MGKKKQDNIKWDWFDWFLVLSLTTVLAGILIVIMFVALNLSFDI